MIQKRTIHAGRTEYFDPETDEILSTYAPGDGKIRFVWCDHDRNDTGRVVTMEEASAVNMPGWVLEHDGSLPYLSQVSAALEEMRSLLH